MTTTKTETADEDIVVRLRAWADSFFPPTIEDVLVAADEIERLREDKLDALAAVESENAFYQEEIERLREALLSLSYIHDGNPSDEWAMVPELAYARHMLFEVRQIARAALKEGE